MSERTLRIVRGSADETEVAALVAVLGARPGEAAPEPKPATAWSDRSALVRKPLPHGPGAWRASAWPH